jgi:hypothetical protein
MPSVVHSKEREKQSEEALIARLRRFVEDSDLSFYVGNLWDNAEHVAGGNSQAARTRIGCD